MQNNQSAFNFNVSILIVSNKATLKVQNIYEKIIGNAVVLNIYETANKDNPLLLGKYEEYFNENFFKIVDSLDNKKHYEENSDVDSLDNKKHHEENSDTELKSNKNEYSHFLYGKSIPEVQNFINTNLKVNILIYDKKNTLVPEVNKFSYVSSDSYSDAHDKCPDDSFNMLYAHSAIKINIGSYLNDKDCSYVDKDWDEDSQNKSDEDDEDENKSDMDNDIVPSLKDEYFTVQLYFEKENHLNLTPLFDKNYPKQIKNFVTFMSKFTHKMYNIYNIINTKIVSVGEYTCYTVSDIKTYDQEAYEFKMISEVEYDHLLEISLFLNKKTFLLKSFNSKTLVFKVSIVGKPEEINSGTQTKNDISIYEVKLQLPQNKSQIKDFLDSLLILRNYVNINSRNVYKEKEIELKKQTQINVQIIRKNVSNSQLKQILSDSNESKNELTKITQIFLKNIISIESISIDKFKEIIKMEHIDTKSVIVTNDYNYGRNAAIVHVDPAPKHYPKIEKLELYLVDLSSCRLREEGDAEAMDSRPKSMKSIKSEKEEDMYSSDEAVEKEAQIEDSVNEAVTNEPAESAGNIVEYVEPVECIAIESMECIKIELIEYCSNF